MKTIKKMIIQQEYVTIIANGAFYDNKSADKTEDIIYLNEPYNPEKNYQVELQKAKEKYNSTRPWNEPPEIVYYWKTIEEKYI